jgi:hypothetical protein
VELILLEALVWLMPHLKALAWTGAGAVVAGVFLMGLRKAPPARWCALAATVLGAVFLVASGLGWWLGVDLALRFDLPHRFRAVVLPFWQIGAGLLGPALGIRGLARTRLFAGT